MHWIPAFLRELAEIRFLPACCVHLLPARIEAFGVDPEHRKEREKEERSNVRTDPLRASQEGLRRFVGAPSDPIRLPVLRSAPCDGVDVARRCPPHVSHADAAPIPRAYGLPRKHPPFRKGIASPFSPGFPPLSKGNVPPGRWTGLRDPDRTETVGGPSMDRVDRVGAGAESDHVDRRGASVGARARASRWRRALGRTRGRAPTLLSVAFVRVSGAPPVLAPRSRSRWETRCGPCASGRKRTSIWPR